MQIEVIEKSIKPKEDQVEVVSCTVAELIDSHLNGIEIRKSKIYGSLTIPEYQRPYVWKEKQIDRLLNDLWEYYRNEDPAKPLFYLGSIILHQDQNKLKIIDGQQRLTTLLLMMKVQDKDFITKMSYDSPKSAQNIKRILSYLKAIKENKIFDFKHNKPIIDAIRLEDINITIITTPNEDLAYTFFETQNTGGIPLTGSQIVKAHHLRAISLKKLVNYQARRWEQYEDNQVEHIMHYLAKARYWNYRNWKRFPFYRDKKGIKRELIKEFSENTIVNGKDVSFHYGASIKTDGREVQFFESQFKQLKQPLSDGNNTMDYINEYIQLHSLLFNNQNPDHRISDTFYEFRDKIIHNGTAGFLLREVLEIAIITYVSRFGFYRLTEASLWLFRFIFSMRVTVERNVREDSVFKMVYNFQLVDNITEVYSIDELLDFLKRFTYRFNNNEKYLKKRQAKDRYINSIRNYFGCIREIDFYAEDPERFDEDLISGINKKLEYEQ